MTGSLGVPELVALNDEIAGLVRAGLPLEAGLGLLGRELPGRLGRISRAVAQRMERGEGLAEALTACGPEVPAAYRAVVEAGLRAGRLPAALEGAAANAREQLELRRTIERSMAYPLLVLMLAYGLGLVFLVAMIPRLRDAAAALDAAEPWILPWLDGLGQSVTVWGAIPPLVLTVAIGLWYWVGRRRALGGSGLLDRVPHVGPILRIGRRASFAAWLGLLVEQRVPLPEGLELAGAAGGDRSLGRAAGEAAARLRAGRPLDDAAAALPPWLGHALLVGDVGGDLPAALREAARHDRLRASHRAAILREWLPGVMLQVIGGLAVLLYAALLVLPWGTLLEGIARPPG